MPDAPESGDMDKVHTLLTMPLVLSCVEVLAQINAEPFPPSMCLEFYWKSTAPGPILAAGIVYNPISVFVQVILWLCARHGENARGALGCMRI